MKNMPDECALAIAKFTEANPAWRGANWDDALDVLMDTDSHLDVTEPIYEAFNGEDDYGLPVCEIAVTLLYSGHESVTPDDVTEVLDRANSTA